MLPVFHRLYPLIEVSLTEGRTKVLEQMALEGAVDFSLVITPLFHPGTLTTIELYQERILIALSEPENRGIYTQSDSSKKSSRNIWSLAVVSVDQRY